MWIEVPRLEHSTLAPGKREAGAREQFENFIKQIVSARAHQSNRFAQFPHIGLNREMNVRDIDTMIKLSPDVLTLLNESAKRLDLSPRAYHRVIKLARTIADLDESRHIKEAHIFEALQYRPKRLFV